MLFRSTDHVMLILDCYVPIYVEVSARNAKDMPIEYHNYLVDLTHWNKALMRDDYFLCANEPQKHMYTGALGALGILNPYSIILRKEPRWSMAKAEITPDSVDSSCNFWYLAFDTCLIIVLSFYEACFRLGSEARHPNKSLLILIDR